MTERSEFRMRQLHQRPARAQRRIVFHQVLDVLQHAGGDAGPLQAIHQRAFFLVARPVRQRPSASHFCQARALSLRNDEPARASRPWDKDRDGFVMAEGGGAVVLEEYEHAQARGAQIYAELVGFGMSGDAHHITSPPEDGEGARLAMTAAIRDAEVNVEAVDYINAHATSTELGDRAETIAIKRALGEHARKVAVSSTKSMTGHLLGAAGVVEAIFSILAIRDGVLPPTINLENPDPECDLDYVPGSARQAPVRIALSNSFGFGGTNGSLIFRALS